MIASLAIIIVWGGLVVAQLTSTVSNMTQSRSLPLPTGADNALIATVEVQVNGYSGSGTLAMSQLDGYVATELTTLLLTSKLDRTSSSDSSMLQTSTEALVDSDPPCSYVAENASSSSSPITADHSAPLITSSSISWQSLTANGSSAAHSPSQAYSNITWTYVGPTVPTNTTVFTGNAPRYGMVTCWFMLFGFLAALN